jgi:hypothetical protein
VRLERRTVAGSERWRPEQTHPGHLAGHAIGADRASRCASSVQTASRSSCAHAATARSPRCQPTTGRRLGHAHGYRAGFCVMVPLGSTAVLIERGPSVPVTSTRPPLVTIMFQFRKPESCLSTEKISTSPGPLQCSKFKVMFLTKPEVVLHRSYSLQ